jgi:hypothetical protein
LGLYYGNFGTAILDLFFPGNRLFGGFCWQDLPEQSGDLLFTLFFGDLPAQSGDLFWLFSAVSGQDLPAQLWDLLLAKSAFFAQDLPAPSGDLPEHLFCTIASIGTTNE